MTAVPCVVLGREEVEVRTMTRPECLDWLEENTPFRRFAWDDYSLPQLRQCVGAVASSEAGP